MNIVIAMIIVLVIVGVCWFIVDQIPMEAQFKRLAKALLAAAAVIFLLVKLSVYL